MPEVNSRSRSSRGRRGTPVVTVQFKEFGVRLKFLAEPNPDGTIRLKVMPEVSSLDFDNAVTLSGFLIPALSTRRAETEVQLRDGQSFAVAGLLDNRVNKDQQQDSVAQRRPVPGQALSEQ